MTSFRTPRSRAQGLGAAKHGVGHFIAQRATAVALVPLALWAVFSALKLASGDYQSAVAWLQHPLNAVLLTLLLATGFYHMRLGMQVVIEDYVEEHLNRVAALLLNTFVCAGLGALAIISVLKVAFSGGAY